MAGFMDRLGDLSWLGDAYAGQGWFAVGDAPPGPTEATKAEIVWEQAKMELRNSDWAVLPDVPMIKSEREAWIAYRKALREIRLQVGFPNDVIWPTHPDLK